MIDWRAAYTWGCADLTTPSPLFCSSSAREGVPCWALGTDAWEGQGAAARNGRADLAPATRGHNRRSGAEDDA